MSMIKQGRIFFQSSVVLLFACNLLLISEVLIGGGGLQAAEETGYSIGHDGAAQIRVASVNGTEITMAQLFRKMGELAIRRAGQTEITPLVAQKVQSDALDILITEELAYQKSLAKVGPMTEEQINQGVEELKDNFGGDEPFKKYLAKEGFSMENYRTQVGRNLVVRNFVRQEFDDAVTVSQEEIDAVYPVYDSERKMYRIQPETIQVAEISLFLNPDDPDSIIKAQKFREKITHTYGGDLAQVPQDGSFFVKPNITLDKNVDRILYEAGKGLADAKLDNGVSEPLIDDGVVKILQLTGHSPEVLKSLDAVRSELKARKKDALVKKWVSGLKEGAKIEIYDITH